MKKRISYLILFTILITIAFSSVVSTLAFWSVQSNTVNKITVGSVKGQITEEYSQNPTVLPGDKVNKVVRVVNTGTSDAVIRVRIDKAWGEARDADGSLIINSEISTDNILITCDTAQWYYDESDGYYYYRNVLKPNELTIPLIREFVIDPNSGNEYKNMQADIVVYMDCIQAGGNGVSIWGKTLDDLGIEYTTYQRDPVTAKVLFLNPDNGFKFNVSNGDLFIKFKDLIPGETHTQIINVTNNYDKKTEIFLRADYIDQTQATDENRQLIDKLLKQYATIVITNDNGTVLYNGPVWGNLDSNSPAPDSMRYNISLHTFEKGTTKNLMVQLTLDPKTQSEYQSLLGLIKWTFEANGRESDYPPPNTGDDNRMVISVIIALLSIFAILVLMKYNKSARREKENRT
ncbi:MAG: hypothetical protein CVU97_01490 [Firmicutes bacterium HGW-Firmicutes-21]|nr:MAG: hypothetical protein CVU97_01490 [Firmicutes bacterium HGW-Firmicutes-21]